MERKSLGWAGCLLALPLVVGSCHDDDLGVEELLASGLTANQVEQLIKQIRGRVPGSNLRAILAVVEASVDELVDEDPDVDEVNNDGSGPDIVARGPSETVAGGTVRVSITSAPGVDPTPQANAFNYVFVTVNGGVESDGPGSFYALKVDADPSTPTLDPVTALDLFITIPDDIEFRDFRCVYQAGLLRKIAGEGVLSIGAVDEDSQTVIDVHQACRGDIQVTLTWETSSDLDLTVLDPNGREARVGGPALDPPFVSSVSDSRGGGNCEASGLLYESLCWGAHEPVELDDPLVGDYVATIVNAAPCERTEFVLTIFAGGELQDVVEGAFESEEETSDPIRFQFPFRADIDLTKTVAPGAADVLDEVTWTLRAENIDLDFANDATGVEVSDQLPVGVELVSASSEDFNSESGIWTIGDLEKGAVAELELVTRVVLEPPPSITNTASAVRDQVDRNHGNDQDSATLTINRNSTVADLGVSLAADSESVIPLEPLVLTIGLANLAGAAASGVVVTTVLGRDLEFVDVVKGSGYDPGTGSWDPGTLDSGDTATLGLEVRVVPDAAAGSVVESRSEITSLGSLELDPDSGNNVAEVGVAVSDYADLSVISIDTDPAAPIEGGLVTYTVVVGHLSGEAADVTVAGLLPVPDLIFDSADGEYDEDTNTWLPGELSAGQTATLELTARAGPGTGGGSFATSPRAESSLPDPDPSDNFQDFVLDVLPSADLALSVTADRDEPLELDRVVFTLAVAHQGGALAENVTVTDLVPEGLAFVKSSVDYDESLGEWAVGALGPGETESVQLTFEVRAGAGGATLAYTATAKSELPDPNELDNEASDSIDVRISPDLAMSKFVDVTEPREGDTLTFTLAVEHLANTDVVATGVTVSEQLPDELTFVSAGRPSQGSYRNGIWDVGALAPGADAELTLRASVNRGTAGESFENTATVISTLPDPVEGNDTASAAIQVQEFVDLSLTKVVDDASPLELDPVTYSIVVRSLDGPTATGVVVSDQLPQGLTFVSARPSVGRYDPVSGDWSIGVLPSDSSEQLDITATVDPTTGGTTIVNVASVTLDQPELDENNNSDSATILPEISPDLSVTKAVSNPLPAELEEVTFTIIAGHDRNTSVTATNVVVEDLLPPGLTWIKDSASQGNYDVGSGAWTVGTLSSGSSATLSVTASVNLGTAGSTIENVAIISGDLPDPDLSDNQSAAAVLVVDTVDLAITKLVDPDDAFPSELQEVTFTLRVDHVAGSSATGVLVSDPVPPGLTFVASDPPGAYDPVLGEWAVGTLLPAVSAQVELVFQVQGGTGGRTITNVATVSSDRRDVNAKNDVAEEPILVKVSPDLSITKSVDDPNPNVGEFVTFSLTVRHNSNTASAALDVVVDDPAPKGLSFDDWGGDGTYDPSTGIWTIGTLGYGESADFSFFARVEDGTEGQTITNRAEVSSLLPDPDETDNVAVASIVVNEPIDLAMSKTLVGESHPLEGAQVTFRLRVDSLSDSVASGVSVLDSLPEGLTYFSHNPGTASYDPVLGRWTIGTVGAGESATLDLIATVAAGFGGTLITNVATVDAVQDVNGENDTAFASFTPACLAPESPVLNGGFGSVACDPDTRMCNCINANNMMFNGHEFDFSFNYSDCNGDVSDPMSGPSSVYMDYVFMADGTPVGSGGYDMSMYTFYSGDGFSGMLGPNPCWTQSEFPDSTTDVEVTFTVTDDGGESSETTITVTL